MMTINQIRSGIRAKYFLPFSTIREQGHLAGASHQSMMRLNKRCKQNELDYSVAETLSDSDLLNRLYHLPKSVNSNKRQPDVEHIVSALTKPRGKRKTRTVLFLEYVAQHPETALSRTHFFRCVRKMLKRSKLTMRQLHVAGEVVYIDYAGTKVFYLASGKKVWVKVFVAVLGASKKIFAWTTYGEKTQHWIDGMTRMFDSFGGVTEVVSMDNAKALVTTPGLIANLNSNIVAFGHHFNAIMDTCRVIHPQDKSHAELGVKFVTQRILVPMIQNHCFFSLDEINHFLTQEVEQLNNTPFQGMDISRNDLFERNEKSSLKALPSKPFSMVVDILKQKVPPNYHVKYLKSEYSVPYQLRGEVVDIIIDQTVLRVIHDNNEVAKHSLKGSLECSTISEHMPAEHLADKKSNSKEANLLWAKDIGSAVEETVSDWYSNSSNPSSRSIGKRCQALRAMCKKHGAEVLCKACDYAHKHGMSTPDDIRLIISANEHEEGFENLPVYNVAHQNVRGKSYFGGNYDA
ncbi:IS21 family transposase [Colwellia sp. BRX8-7]|uniref:IS21 family transposase n=1 Tax=Colwellia sp. BRX8-7 TaxID=2759833 RepID=UPI0015F3D685|nr:IS21 family transposase [Colwellia sp. BRX8-7]MBA6337498.1 IS21 family transposase [Colwellia sp. BRX8-7]